MYVYPRNIIILLLQFVTVERTNQTNRRDYLVPRSNYIYIYIVSLTHENISKNLQKDSAVRIAPYIKRGGYVSFLPSLFREFFSKKKKNTKQTSSKRRIHSHRSGGRICVVFISFSLKFIR